MDNFQEHPVADEKEEMKAMIESQAESIKAHAIEYNKLHGKIATLDADNKRLWEMVKKAIGCLEQETTCVMSFGTSWTQRAYNHLKQALKGD